MARARLPAKGLKRRKDSRDAVTTIGTRALLADLRELIGKARSGVAQVVNTTQGLVYWQVGTRIRKDVLKEKRADYGEQIVATVSQHLLPEFGRGFAEKNLRRMLQFAELFPNQQIVVTLSRQLSWSHFVAIIPLPDDLQRDFYAELCRVERWSVRCLRRKIAGMLFERTALSKKPAELIRTELSALREQDKLTPDLVFSDPYFLDFLGLKDTYSEKIWRRPFCASWRRSSWNWESGLPSSHGRNGSQWTATITISTCSYSTASCGGWSLLT